MQVKRKDLLITKPSNKSDHNQDFSIELESMSHHLKKMETHLLTSKL